MTSIIFLMIFYDRILLPLHLNNN